MSQPSRTARYRTRYEQLRELGHEFTVDATVTRRRLEALQCMGWSLREIGERVGTTQQSLSEMGREGKFGRKRVLLRTERAIAEVYAELHMTPNDTPYSARTRLYAKKRGYAAPLAWDDITDLDEVAIKDETLCAQGKHLRAKFYYQGPTKGYCRGCKNDRHNQKEMAA